ncbi:hypothetical protein EVJ58_g8357 [Rhodofomes roseus]|uniref:Uncharacterized protein n=1 Tax=Rhodofomes roseus TaxID=34475 RepID=A0A4Y9XYT4_9APHY|nr:hypothetical protein EVJ58_g8357 [Rhodofomes roseus]
MTHNQTSLTAATALQFAQSAAIMGTPGIVPLAARSFTSASPSLGKIPAPAPGVANKEVIKATPASTSEAKVRLKHNKDRDETTRKRKASNAGTVSTPAKKTKSKGKAAASVAVDKGKGKAVENEGRGQATASAIAITDSDYEVSSSHSSDDEYDVAEQLMESSDEDTPLLNFQTTGAASTTANATAAGNTAGNTPGNTAGNTARATPAQAKKLQDRALNFEDLRFRIHAFNSEQAAVLADLRIKHAAELRKARMEPAITAANQAKAIKDYYAGSSAARKVGEEIPALEFAAPASALPDADTLLGKMGPNTLGAIGPYIPGWFDFQFGEDQNSTQLAPYVSNAQLGRQAQSGPSTSRNTGKAGPSTSRKANGHVG